MKGRLKNNLFKIIVHCCFATAFLAAGAASYWGGYQPEEPAQLGKYLKNKRNRYLKY